MAYLYSPPYTDLQKQFLRSYMGYSQLFKSSNAIFENILSLIQSVPAYDDGATFNQTIVLMTQLQQIDQLRLNNASLGLANQTSDGVKYDAARNDLLLKQIGRTYIQQLSIIFSMKPARDYFARAATDLSGNVYPTDYDL
jgi:hypothetical protein